MKQRRDFVQKLTQRGGNGDSSLHPFPLVEISDDRRVLVEQHQGVVAYGCGEICVRVRYGLIRVRGASLRLANMTAEQLVICGRIDGVELLRTGRERHE